jgi:allantoate deiminase
MNSGENGRRAEAMLAELGAISDEPGRLTRLYLNPAHRRAIDLVGRWMSAAGLTVRVDSLATVHGLLPASVGGALRNQRLLVGSHIDTVADAGRYDGALGVVAGIVAADEIRARGITLPFALEVLAFGDEEGVRFPKTLASSLAVAGAFDAAALDSADRDGTTLRAALAGFGCDITGIAQEAYRREDVLAYLEVHIEQGPVLEQAGEPLAVMSAIAGQARYRVGVDGEAGHAGTVPMGMRHDALAAAAEMVLAVEAAAAGANGPLVATVGEISVRPGAVNVIPGTAEFSIDIRAAADAVRAAQEATLRRTFAAVAARRGVSVTMKLVHEKPVTPTSAKLNRQAAAAILEVTGKAPHEIMSGAGHDGQAMAHLTNIAMIFVRCRGGISHNPREYASPEDIGLAIEALVRTILRMADAA